MASSADVVEAALKEVDSARRRVSKRHSRQITQEDDLSYLKSVAYAWFQSHRPALRDSVSGTELAEVDAEFEKVLNATAKASARSTYVTALHHAKARLIGVRSALLTKPPAPSAALVAAPDFSPIVVDQEMRDILNVRWEECQLCLHAGAHLAATVMMGGFLEALFVARANQLADKSRLFRAKSAPRDPRTQKALSLSNWTLRHYIDVGFELSWIQRSGKDVGSVLRDYRNYIHPEKQRAHSIGLNVHDSSMFWEITKSLTQQLLK